MHKILSETINNTVCKTTNNIRNIQKFIVYNERHFRIALGYDRTNKLKNDIRGASYALVNYKRPITRSFYNSYEYVAKQNFEQLTENIQFLRLNQLNNAIASIINNNEGSTPINVRCENLQKAFMQFHKPEKEFELAKEVA